MARPQHQVTDFNRRIVQYLAGRGFKVVDIAPVVRVSENTLRKHYDHELSIGRTNANFAVAKKLYELATSDLPGSARAAIFWLRCRGGPAWALPARVPNRSREGGPIVLKVAK